MGLFRLAQFSSPGVGVGDERVMEQKGARRLVQVSDDDATLPSTLAP